MAKIDEYSPMFTEPEANNCFIITSFQGWISRTTNKKNGQKHKNTVRKYAELVLISLHVHRLWICSASSAAKKNKRNTTTRKFNWYLCFIVAVFMHSCHFENSPCFQISWTSSDVFRINENFIQQLSATFTCQDGKDGELSNEALRGVYSVTWRAFRPIRMSNSYIHL